MIDKIKNLTIINQSRNAIFVIHCVGGTVMNVKLIFVKTILFNIKKEVCVRKLYSDWKLEQNSFSL
ncbi:protein of unknown function [Candidatus Nitrosocosmicus franklandus]|uniref:Uncharacterized protein n=1 Tax=Candidatus Nitrosocosmicus franklandianus TaxID=1798806 RepID=A0A484IH15_9ARCH|nr:protein of unknown function [Candidatus Nitrosocosmicus franklandus]